MELDGRWKECRGHFAVQHQSSRKDRTDCVTYNVGETLLLEMLLCERPVNGRNTVVGWKANCENRKVPLKYSKQVN